MFVKRSKWKDVELQSKVRIVFGSFKDLEKDNFFGSSPPSVFIGSKLKYPNVNVGILSPPVYTDESWILDNPNYWANSETTIKDVVGYRSSLINSRFKTSVNNLNTRFLDTAQEIAAAYKPVDIEVDLNKKLNFEKYKDKINLPMGPAASLKRIKITDNVKILRSVEKVIEDVDLKAVDAINYLYKKNIDENFLTKILSIGTLGLKKDRKLVPTRWSITAVDDSLGKNLIENVKNYETIDKYRLLLGKFFGNYYFILLFPDVWSYELFEGYLPGAVWNFSGKIEFATDLENYYGRKNYASNTAGGYYAARLPLLEYLNKIKKQASALVIRFETPEYTDSLGVWVVRSACRKTIDCNPIEFETKEEMLDYVKRIILRKWNYNIENVYNKSVMLKNLKSQSKLSWFI